MLTNVDDFYYVHVKFKVKAYKTSAVVQLLYPVPPYSTASISSAVYVRINIIIYDHNFWKLYCPNCKYVMCSEKPRDNYAF